MFLFFISYPSYSLSSLSSFHSDEYSLSWFIMFIGVSSLSSSSLQQCATHNHLDSNHLWDFFHLLFFTSLQQTVPAWYDFQETLHVEKERHILFSLNWQVDFTPFHHWHTWTIYILPRWYLVCCSRTMNKQMEHPPRQMWVIIRRWDGIQ